LIGLALTGSAFRDWLATHGSRVLIILIAVMIAWLLVPRLLPPAVRRAIHLHPSDGDTAEREKRSETLSHVLVRLSLAAILLIALFMLLGEVGYNLAPVVAGLGIGGIAIGLGAQSLVKDTINGIFILGENQFRRGDFVTVATVSGTVEDVNLRRTVLRDVDGTVHSVPNSVIQVASNHTRDYSGVNVTVLVSHSADLEQALTIATTVGEELARDGEYADDLIEPPRPARIESVDEKGVMVRILGRVRPGRQFAVGFEYRRRLKEGFDRTGLRYMVAAAPPSPPTPAAPAAKPDGAR
jgi:small conductance mechanosensitive channel